MNRSKNADRILAGLAEVVEIAEGRAEPARVHVPDNIDVKAVREQLGLTQRAFALRYGFSPSAVADWEQERRRPEAAARILLKVIATEPEAVDRALATA
jgi:putative transcriptional regulator